MIPVRLKYWAVLVDDKPTPCVSCGREIPAGEDVYLERYDLYRRNPTHESLEGRVEASWSRRLWVKGNSVSAKSANTPTEHRITG